MNITQAIVNKVCQYYNELINLEKHVRKSLEGAPSGKIKSSLNGKTIRFYFKSQNQPGNQNYRYMKKSELPLAKKLCQKEYDQRILKIIMEQKSACRYFLSHYQPNRLKEIYNTLPKSKKTMVTSYLDSDEAYIRKWYSQHPQGENPIPIVNGVRTDRGEWVRSKSEKFIADRLYRNHIPYVYESPVTMPNGKTFYPDFTILCIAERKTIYWEHFGMLGDTDYCSNAIKKLNQYHDFGYRLGESLLITMETGEIPINTSIIDDLIERYFKLN